MYINIFEYLNKILNTNNKCFFNFVNKVCEIKNKNI